MSYFFSDGLPVPDQIKREKQTDLNYNDQIKRLFSAWDETHQVKQEINKNSGAQNLLSHFDNLVTDIFNEPETPRTSDTSVSRDNNQACWSVSSLVPLFSEVLGHIQTVNTEQTEIPGRVKRISNQNKISASPISALSGNNTGKTGEFEYDVFTKMLDLTARNKAIKVPMQTYTHVNTRRNVVQVINLRRQRKNMIQFPCAKCCQKFSSKLHLRRHIKVRHSPSKQLANCKECFRSSYAVARKYLNAHQKAVHFHPRKTVRLRKWTKTRKLFFNNCAVACDSKSHAEMKDDMESHYNGHPANMHGKEIETENCDKMVNSNKDALQNKYKNGLPIILPKDKFRQCRIILRPCDKIIRNGSCFVCNFCFAPFRNKSSLVIHSKYSLCHKKNTNNKLENEIFMKCNSCNVYNSKKDGFLPHLLECSDMNNHKDKIVCPRNHNMNTTTKDLVHKVSTVMKFQCDQGTTQNDTCVRHHENANIDQMKTLNPRQVTNQNVSQVEIENVQENDQIFVATGAGSESTLGSIKIENVESCVEMMMSNSDTSQTENVSSVKSQEGLEKNNHVVDPIRIEKAQVRVQKVINIIPRVIPTENMFQLNDVQGLVDSPIVATGQKNIAVTKSANINGSNTGSQENVPFRTADESSISINENPDPCKVKQETNRDPNFLPEGCIGLQVDGQNDDEPLPMDNNINITTSHTSAKFTKEGQNAKVVQWLGQKQHKKEFHAKYEPSEKNYRTQTDRLPECSVLLDRCDRKVENGVCYLCTFCSQPFKNKLEHSEHQTCKFCNACYANKKSFDRHTPFCKHRNRIGTVKIDKLNTIHEEMVSKMQNEKFAKCDLCNTYVCRKNDGFKQHYSRCLEKFRTHKGKGGLLKATEKTVPEVLLSQHTCPQCVLQFNNKFALNLHMARFHPPNVAAKDSDMNHMHANAPCPKVLNQSSFRCQQCDLSFSKNILLVQHNAHAHPKRIAPKVKINNQMVTNVMNSPIILLSSPTSKVKVEKPPSNVTGEDTNISNTLVNTPAPSLHNQNIFRCQPCNVYFSSKVSLVGHNSQVHLRSASPYFNTNKQTVSKDGVEALFAPYTCSQCFLAFTNKFTYNLHKARIHPPNGAGNDTNINNTPKNTTMPTHFVPNPLRCVQCDVYFKRKDTLARHNARVHPRNVAPWFFKCKTCNKNFAGKGKLEEHIEKCQGYRKESTVVRHQTDKLQGVMKFFECKICNISLAGQASFETHITRYHPEKVQMTGTKLVFLCNGCKMHFANHSALMEHQSKCDEGKVMIKIVANVKMEQVKNKSPEQVENPIIAQVKKEHEESKPILGFESNIGPVKVENFESDISTSDLMSELVEGVIEIKPKVDAGEVTCHVDNFSNSIIGRIKIEKPENEQAINAECNAGSEFYSDTLTASEGDDPGESDIMSHEVNSIPGEIPTSVDGEQINHKTGRETRTADVSDMAQDICKVKQEMGGNSEISDLFGETFNIMQVDGQNDDKPDQAIDSSDEISDPNTEFTEETQGISENGSECNEKSHEIAPVEKNHTSSESALDFLEKNQEGVVEIDLFSCSRCLEIFPSKSSLEFHEKWVEHPPEKAVVRSEAKNTPTKSKNLKSDSDKAVKSFYNHKGILSGKHKLLEARYVCSVCENTFNSKMGLNRHKEYAHGIKDAKKIPCRLCLKTFRTKSMLRHHALTAHRHVNNPIKACLPNLLMNNTKQWKPVKCNKCPKQFWTKNLLLRHQNLVHLGLKNRLKCGDCAQHFCNEFSLERHKQRFHLGVERKHQKSVCVGVKKRLKCGNCEQHFSNEFSLKRHKRRFHLGIQCLICGQRFSSVNELNVHTLSHDPDARPWECPHPGCSEEFKNPDDMKIHRLRAHVLKFHCDFSGCSGKFSTEQGLKRHAAFHLKYVSTQIDSPGHIDSPAQIDSPGHIDSLAQIDSANLTCPLCRLSFSTITILEKHKKQHAVYKWLQSKNQKTQFNDAHSDIPVVENQIIPKQDMVQPNSITQDLVTPKHVKQELPNGLLADPVQLMASTLEVVKQESDVSYPASEHYNPLLLDRGFAPSNGVFKEDLIVPQLIPPGLVAPQFMQQGLVAPMFLPPGLVPGPSDVTNQGKSQLGEAILVQPVLTPQLLRPDITFEEPLSCRWMPPNSETECGESFYTMQGIH